MKTFLVAIVWCLVLVTSSSAQQRVAWTTSRIVGTPDPPKDFDVERVFPNLKFQNPVELVTLGNTGRMLLLDVTGKVFTFEDRNDCPEADLAFDLGSVTDDFGRALGIAAHPNFNQNREVFIVYALTPVARPNGSRLSRFHMTEESPPRFVLDSEEILMTWHSGGHNGSAIRFDPKGYLYFSTGDGARPFPPDEYDVSQDLSDLRSTICRIDVDHADDERPYSIPRDNPFVETPGARPEIWAYGFRNPWRFDFVPGTDRILCGDVGWELWELIHDVRRGGNYGWSIYEGPQPIRSDLKPGPTDIEKPLVSYPHTVGQSVTGGFVCQSDQLPELANVYLYGDYVTGLIWGIDLDENQITSNRVLAETGLPIITFAKTKRNDVLVVSYEGEIYRLVRNDVADRPNEFPRKLSETGLFRSTDSMTPADGVYSYQPIAQAWQDGATNEFLIAIPGTGSIKLTANKRGWVYPTGTVFVKTISLPSNRPGQNSARRVETQILHFDGMIWHPYSYLWNDAQTDAELVPAEGATASVLSSDSDPSDEARTWTVHHRAQCQTCHTRQRGGGISFDLENLAAVRTDTGKSDLDRLIALKIFDRPIPGHWKIGQMVDPYDASADLETRARTYLSANCVHCHRRGGGGTVPLDVTFSNATEKINAVDVAPAQGDFAIDGAKVIVPGSPYHSILFYRMATSGTGHMPKLGSRDNDLEGLKLIHDWIASMPATDANPRQVSADSIPAALEEFAQLAFGDASIEEQQRAARRAKESTHRARADLLERFLPSSERKKRLGEQIDANTILALTGDPTAGREVMMSERFQCQQCHRVKGTGRAVGPDLDTIASKRTRSQLLDSILNPSASIEPAFQTISLLTVDGDLVSGLLLQQSSDAVVIRQANGRDRSIATDDIESKKIQPQSIMPSGLAAQMTAKELVDLLAFLATLK